MQLREWTELLSFLSHLVSIESQSAIFSFITKNLETVSLL